MYKPKNKQRVDLKKADSWLLDQFRDKWLACRAIRAMVKIDRLGKHEIEMKVLELEAMAGFLEKKEKRSDESLPEIASQIREILMQATPLRSKKIIRFPENTI